MKPETAVELSTRCRATIFDFGPFRYNAVRRELHDGQGKVRIGSRALELLEVLLESPGRLYSREELVARVWPRTVVEETSLRVHMSALRRLIGDDTDGTSFIANVPGRGYSFVGQVQVSDAAELLGSLAPPARPAPQRVPKIRLTRPIGRGEAIAQIAELTTRERMVSVVGAGGMGKTTVALAVMETRSGEFSHGVFFADLSGVSDAAMLIVEVGQSCGAEAARSGSWGGAWERLENALRNQQALIVLDNCEHLVDAVATLAERLLRACPGVRILATSREPLEAESEWVYRLAPLDVPEPEMPLELENARSYPAIQLFADRAQAACNSFQLSEGNLPVVRQLCEFLDGIPLAIELAAARVSSLGVRGLLNRLENALELLTLGRRTAKDRHRTLHAVLNWSYELLTPSEQQVLQRLAVFKGSFELEAAVAVAASGELPESNVLQAVLSLCDKSLIARDTAPDGRQLHRLLSITRLFAGRALEVAPDAFDVYHRHARFHLRAAIEANKVLTPSFRNAGRSVSALARIGELRAAIGWSLLRENDLALGMEIPAESARTFYSAGLADECWRYVVTALDKIGRSGLQGSMLECKLQTARFFLSSQALSGNEGQDTPLARIRALSGMIEGAADKIETLYSLCTSTYGHGNYLQTLSCSEEIRELARGDLAPLSVALADRFAALSLHALGQHDASELLAHRVMGFDTDGLEWRFRSEVPFTMSMGIQLTRIYWLRGEFQLAWRTMLSCVECGEGTNFFARCQPLALAAVPLAIWKGDLPAARRWAAELLELSTQSTSPYWQAFGKVYCHLLEGQVILPGTEEAEMLDKMTKLRDIVATLHGGPPEAATLSRVNEGKVGWCAPEVLRLHAMASLVQGADRSECLAGLQKAFELSVEQGARFWSLRIALSQHELAEPHGAERRVAREQMLQLMNAIDDGSDQVDLKQARLLAARPG